MVQFIGRESELNMLEHEYERKGSFVVMYGRRRVGKTTLIKEFIKGKEALYFLASQETELLNIRRFAQSVADFTDNPLYANANLTDWRPLFKALADHPTDQCKVLVIDELPYLVKTNPAFPSILQYAWDEHLKEANVMLILCGSSVHMMHDAVLSHTSPLYGRRTAQLRLLPLRFQELQAGYPNFSYSQLVDVFALTGGVPKYLEFFDEKQPVEAAIEQNVLSTSSFLYEEPRFLLEQEIRDPMNYLSLLTVISRGNRKISEIARALEKPTNEISPYLKALVDLGYLERRVPFLAAAPERSKQGLYYIADSFLDFWLQYVQPFASELELGNAKPSLDKLAKTFRAGFIPFVFEAVSRQAFASLCASGHLDFSPNRIGSYWDRKGTVELDVCATDTAGTRFFLGECKYYETKPIDKNALKSLEKKADAIPGAHEKSIVFGLFSHTGFSLDLVESAGKRNDLVLVNEDQIVR